jgi:hypothetical protein
MRARSALWTREEAHGNPGSSRSAPRKIGGTLFTELTPLGGKKADSALWPKSPARVAIELRRMAPQLGIHGIIVKVSRYHQGRVVSLARITTVAQKTDKAFLIGLAMRKALSVSATPGTPPRPAYLIRMSFRRLGIGPTTGFSGHEKALSYLGGLGCLPVTSARCGAQGWSRLTAPLTAKL